MPICGDICAKEYPNGQTVFRSAQERGKNPKQRASSWRGISTKETRVGSKDGKSLRGQCTDGGERRDEASTEINAYTAKLHDFWKERRLTALGKNWLHSKIKSALFRRGLVNANNAECLILNAASSRNSKW